MSEREEDNEDGPAYEAPKKVDLKDLVNQDQEDESLRKYKEALLGAAASGDVNSPSDDPRRVVVVKMRVLFDDRPDGDIEYDLDTEAKLAAMKEKPFQLKEGCKYKIEVTFRVQHEIVSGLKYVNAVYRKGVRVDKQNTMLGSFGPQAGTLRRWLDRVCCGVPRPHALPPHRAARRALSAPRLGRVPVGHARARPILGQVVVCRRRQRDALLVRVYVRALVALRAPSLTRTVLRRHFFDQEDVLNTCIDSFPKLTTPSFATVFGCCLLHSLALRHPIFLLLWIPIAIVFQKHLHLRLDLFSPTVLLLLQRKRRDLCQGCRPRQPCVLRDLREQSSCPTHHLVLLATIFAFRQCFCAARFWLRLHAHAPLDRGCERSMRKQACRQLPAVGKF